MRSTTTVSYTKTPTSPTILKGFVNSPGAVAGLEYYKELYDTGTPPGSSNWYMGENIDAYRSGQVAMQMNFAFIWPGVEADENVGGGRSGYFPNPAGPAGQFAQLGRAGHLGRGLFGKAGCGTGVHPSGSHSPRFRRNGGNLAATRLCRSVVEDPDFATSQPYAQTFLDSMAIVKDFWAEPAYADLLLANAGAHSQLRCRGRRYGAGGA